MGQYIAFCRATSNSTANTEDTFLDLAAPSGQAFELKRIRVTCATAASDTNIRVKIARKSAIGAGSTAATEVKKNPLDPAPLVVATMKNTTSTYAAGTITDTIDDAINFNARGMYEWVARDDQDMIVSASAGIIGVNIFVSAVSILVNVTMEWME